MNENIKNKFNGSFLYNLGTEARIEAPQAPGDRAR